jgi:hypothetical protein
MKMTHKILIPILLLLGNGCNNPCQQICLDIRDFAKGCGEPFTDDDISECMRNQGQKTGEEKKSCAEAQPLLEEEWTCDTLEVFFD